MGPLTIRIHQSLSITHRKAIQYALRQLFAQNIIRQYTGMAMGQFLPLARAVKALSDWNAASTGTAPPQQGYTALGGGWQYQGRIKGVAAGSSLGEKAYSITYGTPKRPVFGFTFKILVFQYWLHEVAPQASKGPSSGPWGTLEALTVAYNDYILRNWKLDIPNIPDWFVTGQILDAG
jgi:hypothetical protein